MDRTYEDGLRDGRLKSLETASTDHGRRISTLEKAVYGVMAIVVFIEFAPQLKAFFT